MLSQIGLIHLFCFPFFQKAASSTTGLLFLSSLFYQGYNQLRADHPSDSKPGGVCIFYKETLGDRIVKSLSFNDCIICEVSRQNRKGYVDVVYRSPSQNIFEFKNFLLKFEKVLNDTTFCNSLFTIILGDFNAKSSVWWTRDKTTIEGT